MAAHVKELGAILKARRSELGLTLDDMELKVGTVTKSYLSNIERAYINPRRGLRTKC